jgi:hypothetical protein
MSGCRTRVPGVPAALLPLHEHSVGLSGRTVLLALTAPIVSTGGEPGPVTPMCCPSTGGVDGFVGCIVNRIQHISETPA